MADTSSSDLALLASKNVHEYVRGGDSGQHLMLLPGIETIDATQVDTSLIVTPILPRTAQFYQTCFTQLTAANEPICVSGFVA